MTEQPPETTSDDGGYREETYEMDLPVELTNEEIRSMACEMASAENSISDIEEQKAAMDRDFNKQLKEHRGHTRRLAKSISSGEETRPVKVLQGFDYAHNSTTVHRTDTGGVVDGPRAMDADERQTKFPLDEEGRLPDPGTES